VLRHPLELTYIEHDVYYVKLCLDHKIVCRPVSEQPGCRTARLPAPRRPACITARALPDAICRRTRQWQGSAPSRHRHRRPHSLLPWKTALINQRFATTETRARVAHEKTSRDGRPPTAGATVTRQIGQAPALCAEFKQSPPVRANPHVGAAVRAADL